MLLFHACCLFVVISFGITSLDLFHCFGCHIWHKTCPSLRAGQYERMRPVNSASVSLNSASVRDTIQFLSVAKMASTTAPWAGSATHTQVTKHKIYSKSILFYALSIQILYILSTYDNRSRKTMCIYMSDFKYAWTNTSDCKIWTTL